jgi:hypothetical protein
MDVLISGYSTQNDMKNLDDIAEYLKRKIINPLWEKLSPEEKDVVRKAGSMHHGILTPDGSYYNRDKKEILNLYTGGWPERFIKSLVEGVKYYLDELKIKYSSFINDKSKMFDGDSVVRIPILSWKPTEDTPPSLNLANGNAMLIFGQLLKYKVEEGGFYNIAPADLIVKIDNLEKDQLRIHARDQYSSTRGGSQTINGGLDENGIQKRLDAIRNIAQWAIKNHYDSINVA